MHRSIRLAVAVIAVLGTGVGSAAVASAASRPATALSSPAAVRTATSGDLSTSAGTTPAAGRGDHRDLFARADHATAEVKRAGAWVTITVDRGKVTAVSPTSITLARPDGASVTLALAPTTRYHGITSASGIVTGSAAGVRSEGGTATEVSQRPRAAAPTPAGA